MEPEPDTIEIGTIRRAHGIRGQLRVQLYDPGSSALLVLGRVLVGRSPPRAFPLDGIHDLGGGAYLITLGGIADRDAAEALRGLPLSAPRAELPPLGEGEYYLCDLVGCEVVSAGGEVVGRVRAVPAVGGQDMLEVERPGREAALVPLLPVFVTEVDLAARRVVIDPPEGLLDLDRLDRPDRGAAS